MSGPAEGKPGGNPFFTLWRHTAPMRAAFPLLLALLLLGGCEATGLYAAAEAGSVIVLGRGVGDVAVSAITGRNCSIVRLDKGQTYCEARNPQPPPQPFCTRTLGTVNCWSDPGLLPPDQHEVADVPPTTEDQLRYRAARWPKSLFF